MEKSVTDAINFRRSVRKFDPNKEIDTEIVKKCIENGVLAPTSSNLQLWEFYHVTDNDTLKKISTSSSSTLVLKLFTNSTICSSFLYSLLISKSRNP